MKPNESKKDFDLEKWIDADLEPYADMQLSQCDRRAIAIRAFNKAKELYDQQLAELKREYFEAGRIGHRHISPTEAGLKFYTVEDYESKKGGQDG
jgi:hypothetical protein